MTLFFDFNSDLISLDVELVQQVPYGLITYYMALPIAREDNQVSVVMAHPDNVAALQTLEHFLQAKIVPLKAKSEAIQEALLRLRPVSSPRLLPPNIMAWSHRVEQETAVFTTAALFRQALNAEMEMLPVNSCTTDGMLTLAQSGQYTLAVLAAPCLSELPDLFSRLGTPFVLVRGPFRPLRRILVVLRGFASDEHVLDWILPLTCDPETAITLLPLADSPLHLNAKSNLQDKLYEQHLEQCLERLRSASTPIHLKIRQGQPIQRILAELAQNEYDLLVVTAEAQGDYVQCILAAIEENNVHIHRPIFILKPPHAYLIELDK